MLAHRDLEAGELELGLFPLPRVVLFPGMVLPLIVFEPRYRALTADAIAGSRWIGIPRLVPGHEAQYLGCPPICPRLGIGRIVEDVKLPDGRYRIVVQGMARAELLEEVRQTPYRVGRVRPLPEVEASHDAEGAGLRVHLLRQASEVLTPLGEQAKTALEALGAAAKLGQLADLAAATLIADDAVRQQLLETPEPNARLGLIIAQLHAEHGHTKTQPTRDQLN
ncbi:MAG TPA: LON peptidase substrate-binding domain-containing protein [Polyangiaceae bacterium]|jgi:Lon protease-like protein|nr:LON peptidase substrate-binding domain-containing protein [Polyangiaceae bacterium]